MYSSPDAVPLTSSELDSLISQSVKSLDMADQVTRHAHAQLVGHLALSQIERVSPSQESQKTLSKDANSEGKNTENDDVHIASAAVEVVKPLLTPQEMLMHLSSHLNKASASRRIRIGMFDFYAALLTKLGTGFCEANSSLIVSHLLLEIVSSPRLSTSPTVSLCALRYEKLLVRSLAGILLRDLVGVRMLSEQGRIAAIQDLASVYLKRWPPIMPNQTAPPSSVLVCMLRGVSGLLQQLGNALPPVQVGSSVCRTSDLTLIYYL